MIYEDLGSVMSLKDRVYHSIKEAIIDGKLKGNDHLIEGEVAKKMNVSKAPIREAFNKLENDGLVISIPRKGWRVSNITHKSIREVYELRQIMEPIAASLSCGLIPEEVLLNVKEMILEYLAEPTNIDLYKKSDIELHRLIFDYLENEQLKKIMIGIKEHSLRVRYLEIGKGKDENVISMKKSTQEHMKILDAFVSGDKGLVKKAVEEHIKSGTDRVLNSSAMGEIDQ